MYIYIIYRERERHIYICLYPLQLGVFGLRAFRFRVLQFNGARADMCELPRGNNDSTNNYSNNYDNKYIIIIITIIVATFTPG